jgi:hypothetical protein
MPLSLKQVKPNLASNKRKEEAQKIYLYTKKRIKESPASFPPTRATKTQQRKSPAGVKV